MSTTQAPIPRITNAGTKPATPRKLFVNIPITDVQRSIEFFEALGFTFNTQFTDASGTAMLVGEEAYFMLLKRERFQEFTKRSVGDPKADTTGIFAIGVNSREEVDDMVKRAIAAGGSHAMDPQDHGFMYGSSFYDPDGHHFEVFWMDPNFVRG